jgi:hypothetical protein
MKIYFLTKDSFEIDVQNSETITVSELKKIILQLNPNLHPGFNLVFPGVNAKRALSLRDSYYKMDINYVEQRRGKLEGKFEGKLEGLLEGKFEGNLEGKFTEKNREDLKNQSEEKIKGKFEGILIGKFEGKFLGKLEGKLEGKFYGQLTESYMSVYDCYLRNELKLKDYTINNNSELFLIPSGIGLNFIDIDTTTKKCF